MATQAVALAKSPVPAEAPRNQVSFAVTVFLSAFLLFQIELIVAKQLLPWFGGAAAVWNTCLVFFQLLLLAGYLYSHVMTERFTAQTVTRAHLTLLFVSVAVLTGLAALWRSPIYPGDSWRPQNPDHPTLNLMVLLLVSVGLPFFLLSTTGPLAQTWFVRTNPKRSPYQLYALSNLGSLLGLLTYPILFEPHLSLRNQGRVWTLVYFSFVLSCAICALRATRAPEITLEITDHHVVPTPTAKPALGERLLWFWLAACGCILLLSVTNLMCQEIAAVPLLWVLPLSIFLFSFVLCFHPRNLYRRGLFHILFVATSAWGGILFLSGEHAGVTMQVTGFSLLLFACCMVYHGELAKLKPDAQHLTSFYLHIAAGGAFGSLFVGLIAPSIFPAIWEFQLGLWFSGLILAAVLLRHKNSWLYQHPRWLAPAALLAIVALADSIGVAVTIFHTNPFYLHFLVLVLLLATLIAIATGPRTTSRWPVFLQIVALCGWCLFGLLFWLQAYRQKSYAVAMSRNFYGVLRVAYSEPMAERNALVEKHGLTLHGAQLQAPNMRRVPTAYYGFNSGIGMLLTNHPNYRASAPAERHLRIGVIGLGVGTIAAYGQAGDYIRFYEMNPEVVRLAQGRQALFTFLNDSPAKIDIVMGDARLSLERELASAQPQKFDVLAIDAFSSDSIPLHLLTRESVSIYLRHLRNPQSVLAFHISNRTLNLLPVLAGLAEQHHLHIEQILANKAAGAELPSHWVLMAADPAILDLPTLTQRATPIQLAGPPPLWTDDYSNLLQVLR
jgi:hypothetical protein